MASPIERLLNYASDAVADIRGKLVDEGWFQRFAQRNPQHFTSETDQNDFDRGWSNWKNQEPSRDIPDQGNDHGIDH